MVEICDEQKKVFMTKMYKLDNKFTETQNDIKTIIDDVKLTQFLSKKQAVNSFGVAGMTAGMGYTIAVPSDPILGGILFGVGLMIYFISLFWKRNN